MAAAATLDGVIQATKEALEEVERYTPDKTSAPTRPLLVFFFKHPPGGERMEDDKISMQMGKSEYASKIIIEEIEVGVAVGGFSLPDGIYARLAHVTKYSTVLLCCVGHPSRAPKKTAGDYNFSLYRTQINAMFAPVTTYLRSIGHCNVATAVFGIILDGMKSTDGSDKLLDAGLFNIPKTMIANFLKFLIVGKENGMKMPDRSSDVSAALVAAVAATFIGS